MRFESWPIFFLLVPWFLGLRWIFRRNKPAALRLPEVQYFAHSRWNPEIASIVLRTAALVCLVAALARPQTPHLNQERHVSGVDIMLALDISNSMLAEDLGATDRLEVAKATIREFVAGRTNDRVGLLIFSGEAMTRVPPTLDKALVLDEIERVQLGTLLSGTAIGEGLALSVNRLKNSKAKSRIVILLTDGENNRGQIAPLTAGELAKGYGIRVYSIAVGREGRVKVPNMVALPDGRVLKQGYQWHDNQLDTKLLEEISKNTQGKFYRAEDGETLDRVFREIDRLEKSDIKQTTHILYADHFMKWVWLALALLAFERLLLLGVFRWVV